MEKIGEKITAFVPWEEIEAEAQQQVLNVAEMPFVTRVAVMPDCHYGMGATIGTVMSTKGAVIPAAVGVDIGCGMIAVETTIKSHDAEQLSKVRQGLERRIPMSAGKFKEKISVTAQKRIDELEALAVSNGAGIGFYDAIAKNWRHQVGTLGGGNHFIELCIDEKGTYWATLHSGSRGIGNKIGNAYIKLAQKECAEAGVELKDRDLAYLKEGTRSYDDYIRDLNWAQRFALLNREEMMDQFMTELADRFLGDHSKAKELEVRRINCHHNFSAEETHDVERSLVTRKGAIKAFSGDMGMIPGSMGTRSYIVSGKGNEESMCSAPHGAGRRMSRAKAKKQFTMADFDKAMEGIEHRRSEVLLDELPAAYKDIDHVMENAKDLVEVRAVLKQVLNCKGD